MIPHLGDVERASLLPLIALLFSPLRKRENISEQPMAVPKKRTSKSKRDMRRSHDALKANYGSICPNCSAPALRHRACGACGQYRGRQIIKIETEETKSV